MKALKKVLIVGAILLLPGIFYLLLIRGENRYKPLPVFGPRQAAPAGAAGTVDTLYHAIGAFSLTDQYGEPFGRDQIRGKIVVANFFFATCRTICPDMSEQLRRVQKKFSGDPDVLEGADLLILPGVGAFPPAMAALASAGLDRYVVERAHAGKPVVGICLGMHMLLDTSEEHGSTAGLGLIPGKVRQIADNRWHIGWNTLEVTARDPLLQPSDGQSFYFNHSYAIDVPREYRRAIARMPDPVTAVIRRGSIAGLQFHPEKSQGAGQAMLRNLVEGLCA